MCSDKYEPVVSLQEHLEKMATLRFAAMDKEIAEARRIMEKRMEGFPSEFAKRGDMIITAATLKELKDKDIEELKIRIEARMGREEFNQKHETLIEKIDAANEEINLLKNERANIHGRIAATGVVVVILIALVQVVTQVLVHVYMGKQ
jgi:hypothetical protein